MEVSKNDAAFEGVGLPTLPFRGLGAKTQVFGA